MIQGKTELKAFVTRPAPMCHGSGSKERRIGGTASGRANAWALISERRLQVTHVSVVMTFRSPSLHKGVIGKTESDCDSWLREPHQRGRRLLKQTILECWRTDVLSKITEERLILLLQIIGIQVLVAVVGVRIFLKVTGVRWM